MMMMKMMMEDFERLDEMPWCRWVEESRLGADGRGMMKKGRWSKTAEGTASLWESAWLVR